MDLVAGIFRSPVDTGATSEASLSRENLGLTSGGTGPSGGALRVCGPLPPWREAVGRIKAFLFPWRRSRSWGAQPVVTRPASAPPISGASAAPARLFFGNGSRARLLEGPQVQPEQEPLPP